MQRDGGVDGDDEDMCVVCWERPKEVIFLSCGHMVSLRHPLPQHAMHCEAIAPFLHQASSAHELPLFLWQAPAWSLPEAMRQPCALCSAPAGDVQQISWRRNAAPSAPCAGERSRQLC